MTDDRAVPVDEQVKRIVELPKLQIDTCYLGGKREEVEE